MAVQTLTVDGDGNTTSGWAAEGGDFTRVQSDDGDTTRLYTPTSNDVRQFSLTNTSGLTGVIIDSVKVYAKFRSLDPVSNTFQIGVRTNSTDYWSSDKDTVSSTSYILFDETWATNPNTGVAWTVSDLDALQVGVKKTNMVGGAVTYVYVEVNYTVPVGIAFDAASNSGYQAASSGYSWSHTCTGSDRYLVVGVAMLSLAQTVSSITYNSVNLSLIGVRASVSGAARVELWGLAAPSTGSNTIAVTLSGSIASASVATSLTGVHQTSPIEGFNSAQATNVGAADATVDVTTVADNDWTVDIVATDDTAITVGAGQTQRGNVTGVGGSGAMSTEGPKTPAGSVTMNWTDVGALATWAIGSVAIRPITASDLSSTPLRMLMGMGT